MWGSVQPATADLAWRSPSTCTRQTCHVPTLKTSCAEPTPSAPTRTPRAATLTSRCASTAHSWVRVIEPGTRKRTTMSKAGPQARLTRKDSVVLTYQGGEAMKVIEKYARAIENGDETLLKEVFAPQVR